MVCCKMNCHSAASVFKLVYKIILGHSCANTKYQCKNAADTSMASIRSIFYY